MTTFKKRPPLLASWLLKLFVKDEVHFPINGDFDEEYYEIAREKGTTSAWLWYWVHFFCSLPFLIKDTIYWRFVMLGNYFKIAIRHINRYKGYSFINISGLAIGMACCILILLWVQDELRFDKFHKNADDIYRLTTTTPNSIWSSSPWALMPRLKKDFPEVIEGTWYAETIRPVKNKENVLNEKFALVSPEFFEIFTFPFKEGDPKTALTDLNSVVVTERTAKKYFGMKNAIGQVIHFDNRVDLAVTGVIENVPVNSSMQFDFLTHPAHVFGEDRLKTWSADCASYVLLHGNADAGEVDWKIKDTINKYRQRTSYKLYASLQPLKRIHLYSLNGTDPVVYVYLFIAVAVIVLLVAGINFVNLSTARSSKRAKEVGMRKVIGATRKDVVKQFFGESVLLAVFAMIMAVLLVFLVLPAFNSLTEKQLNLNFAQNFEILMGIVLIAVFTGIISGIYPALFLSSFQPLTALKSTKIKSSKGWLFRKYLIVIQFTASIALIISTTVVFKQMNFIRSTDLGFNRDQIVTIRTSRELRRNYKSIKQELLNDSRIKHVTAASSMPLQINNNNPVYWEGRTAERSEQMNFACVDYDYFESFDMKMTYGRSFSQDFPTDRGNYIINETALKMTGFKDPIGKMFSMGTNEGELVGVVRDFHGTSLHSDIRPVVFCLYQNLPYFQMFVKIDSTDIPSTITNIKNTVTKFTPNFIFSFSFLDEEFDRQYRNEERLGRIFNYFTFFAIFVSCLGLFGLASFTAEQKTKEIAVRKVLGASVAKIVGRLSKEFLILVGIANVIAWPLAYVLMEKWIQSYSYHTKIRIWMFFGAGIVALIIALLTVSYQSIKAASKNPVESLKYE
jgi:putative ABC transport system permease protein